MTEPEEGSSAPRPQRTAAIVGGAIVVFIAGWMTSSLFQGSKKAQRDCAEEVAAATTTAIADAASEAASGAVIEDAGAPLEEADADAGDWLTLPKDAPRSVRLGVVLVEFAGAEGASKAAPAKSDAAARAAALLETARTSFSEAVRKGDPGSADDIGRIPRGVLDPSTEATVFRLKTADVSGVLETPRGYWIVKRID